MNKLIYLFEFDSVKNSQEEIRTAHNTLFNEIIINGNNVVFTFNQLSDSLALTSLLQNEKNFETILGLFNVGTLKISRYGKYRTAAQYILNGIEKCTSEKGECFYFSGLPLVSSDKLLLECLNDALIYSDPNLLRECANQYPERAKTLDFLYRYVKFISAISQSELTYTPVNTDKHNQYSEFMTTICNTYYDAAFQNLEIGALLPEAIDILKKINEITKSTDNRSSWLQVLCEFESITDVKALCEGIIHLCYNYAVEDSINGVSKQYTDISDRSFTKDFEHRLTLWWQRYKTGLHKLHFNDSPTVEFPDKKIHINWKTALRIIKSISDPLSALRDKGNSLFIWGILIVAGMLFRLLTIPVFIGGFVLTEYILGELIDYGSSSFSIIIQNRIVFECIIIAISGAVSSLFSKLTRLPDILESFCAFFFIIIDLFTIIKFSAYNNRAMKRRA